MDEEFVELLLLIMGATSGTKLEGTVEQ